MKTTIMAVALLLFLGIEMSAQTTQPKRPASSSGYCLRYVDNNNDGICDNRAGCNRYAGRGQGRSNGAGMGNSRSCPNMPGRGAGNGRRSR